MDEIPCDAHANVRRIHQYWESLAPGPGMLPGRRHFDPVDVPGLLSNVWLVDVVRGPLRFRIRLTGTAIDAFVGRSVTGQWVDEATPEALRDDVVTGLTRVVETGRPSWWRGQPLIVPRRQIVTLERCHLPLAADGRTVDMILCLTIFERQRRQGAGTTANERDAR